MRGIRVSVANARRGGQIYSGMSPLLAPLLAQECPLCLPVPLLFAPLSRGVGIGCGLFDAGYDSERNHFVARQCCHVRSVIPALIGKPPKDPQRPPDGRWRRVMRRYRDSRYGQRWQVESVISMIKRRQGGYVLSRSNAARYREMSLKVLTHNIMIAAEAA